MSQLTSKRTSIWKDPVFIVALINGIGAFIAFFKDVSLAMFLGTSVHADAFTLAFFVPDMVGNNLIGWAVGTVCIPLFARLVHDRSHLLAPTVKVITGQFAGFMIAVTMICLLFTEYISTWLGGRGTELSQLTNPLLLIMLPVMALFPLAYIGAGIHQAKQRFIIPITGPYLVNCIFLIALLASMVMGFSKETGSVVISWSYSVGAVLMISVIWFPMTKMLRERSALSNQDKLTMKTGIGRIWTVFGYYSIMLLATQAILLAERYFAARTEDGAVAALNFAFRITQLPIWVYVAAFGTVMLPRLTKQMADHQSDEFETTFVRSFRTILIITVPTMVLMWFLREPVTALLFQRGEFTDHSVKLTASVLEGYTLTIVFQSFVVIALRYFLATDQMRFPAAATLASSAICIGFDAVLTDIYGLRGLGYGAAIGAMLNAVAFGYLMRKHIHVKHLLQPLPKIAIANAPLALLLYLIMTRFEGLSHLAGFIPRLIFLTSATVLYGTGYLVIAKLMGIIEWNWEGESAMAETLVIIPAYNEEDSIEATVTGLLESRVAADVLIVNDGSTDRTRQIIERLGVHVVHHPVNLGYGAALQTGYKFAVSRGYSYVVQFDADGQHDVKDLHQLMEELRHDDADVVIGSRFLGNPNFDPGWSKRVAIRSFRSVIYGLTRMKVTDPTSGLRGLNAKVFRYYSEKGRFPSDFPDADIIIHMLLSRFRLREFPIGSKVRVNGISMHAGLKPIIYMSKVFTSILAILLSYRMIKRGKNDV